MSNITFINFNDGKDDKRSRIRSHAQSARYRRERMLTAQQHKWRVGAYGSKSVSPTIPKVEPVPEDGRVETQSSGTSTPTEPGKPRKRKERRKPAKPKQATQLPTPPKETVSLVPLPVPNEQRHMELVLAQTSTWVQATYHNSWQSSIKHDRLIYDFDNGIETLRDSFLLVSDLVAMQNNQAAFKALNLVLDVVPNLLKNPHPELLYVLIELGAGVIMENESLRTMVKVGSPFPTCNVQENSTESA
jgi:hypothetical protein